MRFLARWFRFAASLTLVFLTQVFAAPVILVSDAVHNEFRQYDAFGNEFGRIRNPLFSFPTFIAAEPGGRAFLSDINFVGPTGPDLIRFDASGQLLARASSATIFGVQGGGFVDAVDTGRGTYLVTSSLNLQIAELDRDLTVLRRLDTGAVGGGLRTLGVAMSSDGTRVYVADGAGQNGAGFVRVFDYASGAALATIASPLIQFPFGLAVDAQDQLFVTDRGVSFVDDRILVVDSAGSVIRELDAGGPVALNFGPVDLLPDGSLVVLETNALTSSPIRILDAYGQLVREFGDGSTRFNGLAVYDPQSVPEPGSLGLMGLAILGVMAFQRRPRPAILRQPPDAPDRTAARRIASRCSSSICLWGS